MLARTGLGTLCGLDMTPRSKLGVRAMTIGVVLSEFGPQPIYKIVTSSENRTPGMAPDGDA